jgi:oligoribonuclease NrnB/cAMP/cGMP phosphodiesterase (DHH superfamily)
MKAKMMLQPKDFDFKNTILVTHKNCSGADGPTCEILFLAVGGKKENVFYCHPSTKEYSDTLLDLRHDSRQIIFADIGMSVNEGRMFNKREDVVLFDHHKTAIDLKQFEWCEIEVENKRCGSRMLYDWLLPEYPMLERYAKLVSYVDDYDRWQWQYKEKTEQIHNIYEILGVAKFIARFASGDTTFSSEEIAQLRFYKSQMRELIDQKVEKALIREINGIRYGIVFSERFSSQIGNAMCEELDIDAALIVSPHSISVRSRKGFDASQLAKANGGGGHSKAAGMPIEKILQVSLLDLIIHNINFV